MPNDVMEYVERPEFAVQRTTTRKTKAGDVTTTINRGLLRTIVAGKTDERILGGVEYGLQLWERHQYGALMQDFFAVFPTVQTTAASVNESRLIDDPDADQIRINGNYRKSDAIKLMAIACKATGADKGEKAKFVAIARGIAAAEHALQMMLEVKKEMATRQLQLEQGLISQEEYDAMFPVPQTA